MNEVLIQGYYTKYLGRSADTGGLNYYLDMVEGGHKTLEEIETIISTSDEAQNYVPKEPTKIGTPSPRYITDRDAKSKPWIIDTSAYLAWQAGWTGEGVRVGVMDDFSSSSSHGRDTSRIVQDIAIDADVERYSVFNNAGDFQSHLYGQQLHRAGEDGCRVVNMSVGAYGWAQAQENPAIRYTLVKYDMLLIITSGNGLDYTKGKYNGGDAMTNEETTYYALSAVAGSVTRGHTLVVGSVDNNNRIEYGSGKAGITKEFFLCAEDDLNYFGNAGRFEGTSFSAPRVTGLAALLRHKYPAATAPEIQRLLLDTCMNIGEPMVYGQGKVDIMSAIHGDM